MREEANMHGLPASLSSHRMQSESLASVMAGDFPTVFQALIRACAVQLINEKPQIVQEYESGKAIPNPQILNKLSRALGVSLSKRGPAAKAAPKKK